MRARWTRQAHYVRDRAIASISIRSVAVIGISMVLRGAAIFPCRHQCAPGRLQHMEPQWGSATTGRLHGIDVLDSFRNAVAALRAVQSRSEDGALMAGPDSITQVAIRSGVIQHFEFTFEFAWKFMRRQLEADIGRASVDGIFRRDLFRIAAENGLIDDVEAWFQYHLARNQTSHTYDPHTADSVYATALEFACDAADLLAKLEARNA